MKRTGSIYKIVNNKNGKVYIGQTIQEPKQRFSRHLSDSRQEDCPSPLHRSIKKNGEEDFYFQVIEQVSLDKLNEREVFYISEFDSTNSEKGYNLTLGGRSGQGAMTRNKLTLQEASLLILDLENTLDEFSELAEKYGVSKSVVHSINSGRSYFFEGQNYPARKRIMVTNLRFTDKDEYFSVIRDLGNLEISYKEIEARYNISKPTLVKINKGESVYKERYHPEDDGETFPIRMKSSMTRKVYNNILRDLKSDEYSVNDLCDKYNLSRQTISTINNGRSYKIDGITYPIRKWR